jgi:hypothetical protein
VSSKRKNSGVGLCRCLEQAFTRMRKGEKPVGSFVCTSEKCSVRQIEPSVVENFLELIGALPDEASTLAPVTDDGHEAALASPESWSATSGKRRTPEVHQSFSRANGAA